MKELLYGIEKLYPFRMRLNIDDATPQGIYVINSAYVYLEISVPLVGVVDPDEPVDPDIPIDVIPSTWKKPTARKIVMNFGANPRGNGDSTTSDIEDLIKGSYYHTGASTGQVGYCPTIGNSYNSASYTGLFARNYNEWFSRSSAVSFRCIAIPS